jgi:Tat protein secretion system quality control protein TatD with DNase activity
MNIYNKGIDMKYVIQSFFGIHHIQKGMNIRFFPTEIMNILENWINVYSKYLEHPIVYATIGIHPLLAHHFDFELELNMRHIIRNPKIIGIGEIGLDFLR